MGRDEVLGCCLGSLEVEGFSGPVNPVNLGYMAIMEFLLPHQDGQESSLPAWL